MGKSFIYKLENLNNGKIYVGRTTNPELRKYAHISALNGNRHPNELMQKDFNEGCKFEFSIIFEGNCGSRTNVERDFILKLKSYDTNYGYNYKDPVVYSNKGKKTRYITL